MIEKCFDCGIELTKDIRSKYQPKLRCLECFEKFSSETTSFLEGLIKEMNERRKL